MKYTIIFLLIILFSCKQESKKITSNNKIIHKIYCKDTSQVEQFEYEGDTLYRFKINTYNKDINLADGDWIIYYDEEFTQKLRILPIKDKHQNGKEVYWYKNGQKKWESEDSLGLTIGQSLSWFESGQLERECNYRNDTVIGLTKEWFENGKIRSIKDYKDGLRHKEIIYRENGSRVEYYFDQDINSNFEYFSLEFDSIGYFTNAYKHLELEIETIKDKEWVRYNITVDIDSLNYTFSEKYKEELKKDWIKY